MELTKKSADINEWVADTKSTYRNNSNDNDVLSNGRISETISRIHDTTGREQTGDNGTSIIKSDSENESIKNSNNVSVSL